MPLAQPNGVTNLLPGYNPLWTCETNMGPLEENLLIIKRSQKFGGLYVFSFDF